MNQIRDRRWPDFLVIGVPRSGTTTLHAVLDSAPSICMSATKEPRYFHGSDNFALLSRRIRDTEEYLDLWARCSSRQLKGEASPTYFQDPDCPAAIRAAIPDARLILTLRNPVDRAISHFYYREKRTGKSDLTLNAAIDAAESSQPADFERSYLLQPGFYGRYLRRWLEFFDAAQIKIMMLERLSGDFRTEMETLFSVLGLPVEEVAALEPMQEKCSVSAAIPRGCPPDAGGPRETSREISARGTIRDGFRRPAADEKCPVRWRVGGGPGSAPQHLPRRHPGVRETHRSRDRLARQAWPET